MVLAGPTDTDPPASAILTIDSITGINDVSAPAAGTEWTASGMSGLSYLSASSFSVAGDQTTVLHVGRRLKTVNTGGTVYCTIIRSVFTTLTTVTVLTDSGSLDSGLSAFSYGIVSAANTSLPFVSRDQQCGRLVYVSATQIRLDPQDGNTMWVYSGSNWRRRIIPSAGITAANTNVYVNGTAGQNLAANTQYFVCLFDLAGVLTHDFVTTVPAVDATSGLKIKTGDPTRLLIGQVRTNASTPGQFQTPGLVLSWYQRRAIAVAGTALSGPPTTTSTSTVELTSAARVTFLSWAEEAVEAEFTGYASSSGAGIQCITGITLDGIVTTFSPIVIGTSYASGAALNHSCYGIGTVTEGYHYVTLAVSLNTAGTGTWGSGGILYVRTQG